MNRNRSISISHLNFTYTYDSGSRTVFKDFSMYAASGSFCCITGPSGCGKSTLLKLIGGFAQPDTGTLLIGDTSSPAPGRDRIMIFQEFDQLFPWMTVMGNLQFPLRHLMRGSSNRDIRERTEQYLNLTGLTNSGSLYPYQLSGGMKQRAAIARALVLEPDIFLMDEPFGSLDQTMRRELQNLVLQISRKTGTTIIFVTHDITEAVYLADTVVVLSGRGELADFVTNPLAHPRNLHSPEAAGLIAKIVALNQY
jgi:NitT/TauT family transport system ATP-binding protein